MKFYVFHWSLICHNLTLISSQRFELLLVVQTCSKDRLSMLMTSEVENSFSKCNCIPFKIIFAFKYVNSLQLLLDIKSINMHTYFFFLLKGL